MDNPLTAPVATLAAAIDTHPATAPTHSTLDFLKRNFREYGMLISLVAIMGFFQVMTDGTLMQPLNLTNLVLQNSYIVIMALGMLLVIVAGHIDLSVGSVCGFIGALAAVLMVNYEWHVVPATLLCLGVGALIGAAQGWFVAFFRIPSFIVTLAGMLVFKGLALALLQGQSVGPFPESFQKLSSGFIPDLFSEEGFRMTSLVIGAAAAALLALSTLRSRRNQVRHGIEAEPFGLVVLKITVFAGLLVFFSAMMASYKGLPNVLIVMAVLIVAFDFITSRTTLGRRIYALGGNEKAAKLSGIKTERLELPYTFVNMGVLAALAGMMFADPPRLGDAEVRRLGFELDVIAACFIGGASASGGVGTVMGAVIGAFIMGVMNNGMSMMGIGIDWQFRSSRAWCCFLAVFLDVYNKNK